MATLKSREILKQRQAQAQALPKKSPSPLQISGAKYKRTIQNTSVIQAVQNPLGIAGGIIQDSLNSALSGEYLQDTPLEGLSFSSGTLKYTTFWRLKLLMKDSHMEKTEYSPRPFSTEDPSRKYDDINLHTTKTLSSAEKNSPDAQKIENRRLQREEFIPSSINYIKSKFEALENIPKGHLNEIIIINSSVSPYIALTLQNRPNELRIDPRSTWASVSSMGRNNPFMMYTGGEDIISFEVSWFANDKAHREEVITKCKLLESWTKADGYMAAPPVLQIMWGSSGLFDNDYFILESAPYTLTHFQDRAWSTVDTPGTVRTETKDLKLYPNYATQTLTFKKVTGTNLTHQEILPMENIEGISGISPKTTTV